MNLKFEKPDIPALRKEHMLVDMHFHSRYSQDSSTSVRDIVNRCKELGVHVALTDHNSIRGVLRAEEIAPGVIKPGVEITTREGKDVLVYFYDVDELAGFFMSRIQPHVKNKSSIRQGKTSMPVRKLMKLLSNERCVIVIAHPFAVGPRRSYRFFKNGHADLLEYVHGVDCVNQAVPHKRNLAAVGWTLELGKSFVGGSDGHILDLLGSAFTYAKTESWAEFLDAVKQKNVSVVGEEKMLHQHVTNMARILREKTKVVQNRRIRNGTF